MDQDYIQGEHWKSDGNSFWGDVVLDSVNMEYRIEDSIEDNMYEEQIFSDLYYEDFKIDEWLKKIQF